jgi:DNA-binding CsgD family transcriptional regulator
MNGPCLVIQSPTLAAGPYALSRRMHVVGRSSTCDFVVKHITVSRRHAEITVTSGVVSVLDLGSHNGTFVNGERVQECPVALGQSLRFGSVSFLLTNPTRPDDEASSEAATSDARATRNLEPANSLLSQAQRRVFVLLLKGLAEKKIAERLFLSPHTVHTHVREIYRILTVHSRLEMMARYLRRGGDTESSR